MVADGGKIDRTRLNAVAGSGSAFLQTDPVGFVDTTGPKIVRLDKATGALSIVCGNCYKLSEPAANFSRSPGERVFHRPLSKHANKRCNISILIERLSLLERVRRISGTVSAGSSAFHPI